MPPGCRALYQRRSEIFRQAGPPPSNDKIKLMTCLHAFKASMQYRVSLKISYFCLDIDLIKAKTLEKTLCFQFVSFYVFTSFENNFQMNQDSLQCDGTTAAILNDLFSESPSVVDSAVERIRTAWTRKNQYIFDTLSMT